MHKARKLLFPQLGTAKSPSCSAENLKKLKIGNKLLEFFFQKMPPIKRTVPKTPRSSLSARKTFGFL